MNILKKNERFDLIQKKGLGVIQNSKWFSYGIDSVLLSNFVKIKENSMVIDLGTGTGIIPLLLSIRDKASIIYGIEKQDEVAEMANRSIVTNKLEKKIKIKKMDVNDIFLEFSKSSFDTVVSNPPYFSKGDAITNTGNIKSTSRHETSCTLEGFIIAAAGLLKENGVFYMVHRPMRLVDILYYCRKYKLEPKEVQFIYPNVNKSPNILLIKCVKGGNTELKFLDNIYVYNERRKYTPEIYNIYKNLGIDVFDKE